MIMSNQNSIFHAIYYGSVVPWEGTVHRTKEQQEQINKSAEIHDKLRVMLSEESKSLFEDFLSEQSKVANQFEEEKFKDGFILGARLMIETFLDERFTKK